MGLIVSDALYPAVRASPGKEGRPKIIITGPGSTGSTFLTMVLSRWFDAGGNGHGEHYPFKRTKQEVHDQPEMIKHPYLMLETPCWLRDGWVEVRHVLLTYRDADQTIMSIIEKGLRIPSISMGMRDKIPPLPKGVDLYLAYGFFVHEMVTRGISMTHLMHPRMALNASYCYESLGPLRDAIPWVEFLEEHARVSDPSKIKERQRC